MLREKRRSGAPARGGSGPGLHGRGDSGVGGDPGGAGGTAALGVLADAAGIRLVFGLCSVLPVLGVLTVFLPRRAELG
ncbi:hypothetical protein [Mangrovicoccus ximenensis]|uniref:hypothetical protein n=1 Tax=Mangrovicoccus ximenensis TaxID=1911570 RepID=UPI0011AE5403|nr:hypothetical protein [Mangrovicoccus ximenensis]